MNNNINELTENENNEVLFDSFASSKRTIEDNQSKAQRDDYTSSMSGALDDGDSYESELTDQVESANEKSFYEEDNNNY